MYPLSELPAVAIKTTKQADDAASVLKEAELMLQFDHINVTSSYHYADQPINVACTSYH